MRWLGRGIGILLIVTGIVWILQGLNLLGGSVMSGRPIFSILGLVLVAIGALVAARTRRSRGAPGSGS